MNSPQQSTTVATALVQALKKTGTRRIFGLPGGGSSLDLIEAGRQAGLPFVLARHETAAAMMAATTAELDGSVGAVLSTKGPGTANSANGVAHASLDRCPMVMITDGFAPAVRSFASHQWFDQQQMLAPVVKAHDTLAPASQSQIDGLLACALAPRQGPVHIELTGPAARAGLESAQVAQSTQPSTDLNTADLERAAHLLLQAKRPVLVAGLEARQMPVADALRSLTKTLNCPALVTYKAKGVIRDDDPNWGGIFTGGAAEKPLVSQADLIILVGVDPVELILQPWPYDIDVLELSASPHPVHYFEPACALFGDLAPMVQALAGQAVESNWPVGAIEKCRRAWFKSLRYGKARKGLSPEQVVVLAEQVSREAGSHPRVTVDAGAHMFSATTFWPCYQPCDLLISNGLATMGYALPAGIAAALHEPERPVLAFTGDGGLLMCLGDLATAVEQSVNLIIIVFNDGALSLIDIKQQQRELPVDGVRWPRFDFAGSMKALGGAGYRVRGPGSYRTALSKALAHGGPALIDVWVDPDRYPAQLRALRG